MSAEKKRKLNHHDVSTLDKFFEKLTCSSPGFPNEDRAIVTIQTSNSVSELLKKLIDNRILSCPIVDETGKAVGIASILDLMAHSLKHFDKLDLKSMTSHSFNFYNLVIEKNELKNEAIGSIKEIGQVDPIYVLKYDRPLKEAVNLMAKNKAHRILVVGDKGEPRSVITQSQIIRLITLVLDNLQISSKTISDLGIATKDVIAVGEDEMARNAFQKMKENHVSAVAVVNSEGQLVGNISASDIKLLGYSLDWFDNLADNSKDYLANLKRAQDQLPIRSKAFHLENTGSTNFVVKCSPNTTLGVVVKMILFYEIHRVYVTDSNNVLVGVVTLGDIIKTIFDA